MMMYSAKRTSSNSLGLIDGFEEADLASAMWAALAREGEIGGIRDELAVGDDGIRSVESGMAEGPGAA